MDDINTPVNGETSHIKEIKEPEEQKKKKREKQKIPLGTLAVMLVICIVVSMFSGAGGSLMMLQLINRTAVKQESETKEEFQIEDDTRDVLSGITENEEETFTIPEPSSGTEVSSPEETTAVSVTEPVVNVTPEVPSLSKGDIYSDSVDSIFLITSSWKQYYDSIFGSYYRPATSTGTGFAISSDGYIVTNHHVIEKAEEITVTDYNGKEYKASLIGSEPSNDIAVLRINEDTKAVNMGESSALKVGDDIMVIGNALGELSYTFTDGIISHLSRMVTVESGETMNMFQTNAAINNGNSGGPVYNMDGEVVGIASAKYFSESIEGLGFCIPIDDVKSMITDIILYGYVKGKPVLGVSLQTVTSSMSSRYSIPVGCYIVAIDNSSAAYLAGIRQGDVITKIGDTKITSTADVKTALYGKSAGNSLYISYYSAGETKTAAVKLGEYAPSEPRTNYSNVIDF